MCVCVCGSCLGNWFTCVYSQTEMYTGSSRVEPRKVLILLVNLLLECFFAFSQSSSIFQEAFMYCNYDIFAAFVPFCNLEKVFRGEYVMRHSSNSSSQYTHVMCVAKIKRPSTCFWTCFTRFGFSVCFCEKRSYRRCIKSAITRTRSQAKINWNG